MKDQKKMEKINEKADKREEEASIALASIGNPWDNVSFDDKKRFGLFYYFESVKQDPSVGCHGKSVLHAAKMVDVTPRSIQTWLSEFEELGAIKSDGRGAHSKSVSPMDNAVFRESLKEFVKVCMHVDVRDFVHAQICGYFYLCDCVCV